LTIDDIRFLKTDLVETLNLEPGTGYFNPAPGFPLTKAGMTPLLWILLSNPKPLLTLNIES
jgi:hypothetical protein